MAILKSFADRRKIDFPMLADPDSKILREYQVVNDEATGQFKGMARPGYFFIDTQGVIREKFFEAKYRERVSANSLMAKLFPELGEEVASNVEAPHLQLAVGQSDRIAYSGNHVTLTAEVQLPPDVHVYAPGVKGYKPIRLQVEPMSDIQIGSAVYPRAKILYLPAIKERVPVFEGKFFIRQDVQVATGANFGKSLGADGRMITIPGKLEYQACDSKICFLPSSIPVQWQLQLLPLDVQRAPDDIKHK